MRSPSRLKQRIRVSARLRQRWPLFVRRFFAPCLSLRVATAGFVQQNPFAPLSATAAIAAKSIGTRLR